MCLINGKCSKIDICLTAESKILRFAHTEREIKSWIYIPQLAGCRTRRRRRGGFLLCASG